MLLRCRSFWSIITTALANHPDWSPGIVESSRPANERPAIKSGVTRVVIPYAGKASATRKQREKTR